MKFAHLGDCHLGGWRFPELNQLNMQSFSNALEICIKEKVDLVLIAGDLFDSAYPGIETLKQTFAQFRKLHEAEIPCFIIAGSHDYSVAGNSFLDVLEHAGFCKNTCQIEEKDNKLILQPIIHNSYAIYGYPGKKSGLETSELLNVETQEAPGFFKILMLHTSLKEAIPTLPIQTISISQLPKADYYALGHLHVDFCEKNIVYSGPIFPNNFDELEELNYGQFYIVEYNNDFIKPTKIPVRLKQVESINIEITNTLTATDKITSILNDYPLEDKIVLLKLHGNLQIGKITDIDFNKIEQFVKNKNAYVFLKSTSKLFVQESKIQIDEKDVHKIEQAIIEQHSDKMPEKFKPHLNSMLKSLDTEKYEDETNQTFQDRFMSELKQTLNFETD